MLEGWFYIECMKLKTGYAILFSVAEHLNTLRAEILKRNSFFKTIKKKKKSFRVSLYDWRPLIRVDTNPGLREKIALQLSVDHKHLDLL